MFTYLHVKVKFDQLTDTVTSLTEKLTEITKQNKDLKSVTLGSTSHRD